MRKRFSHIIHSLIVLLISLLVSILSITLTFCLLNVLIEKLETYLNVWPIMYAIIEYTFIVVSFIVSFVVYYVVSSFFIKMSKMNEPIIRMSQSIFTYLSIAVVFLSFLPMLFDAIGGEITKEANLIVQFNEINLWLLIYILYPVIYFYLHNNREIIREAEELDKLKLDVKQLKSELAQIKKKTTN